MAQMNLPNRNRPTCIENQLMWAEGKKRINYDFEINIYTEIHIKQINNRDLVYNRENCIQYFVKSKMENNL